MLLSSCRDGSTPIAPEFDVRLDVSIAVAPAWTDLFASSEVDGLRALAVSTAGQDVLGVLETEWGSGGLSGSTALDVTVRDGGPFGVTVVVELLDGGEVVWSGRSEPTEVTATPFPVSLTLYRGPQANLSVSGLEIGAAPSVLDEGASTRLAAEVATDDPATRSDVRVFWVSRDPDVAVVDAEGLVTAMAPGTASILAVAGAVGDTATLSVEAVPTDVILDPPSARLTSLLEQLTLEAAVVDARGDTLTGHALVWESTDSAVLVPLGGGVYEAAGPGEAEAVATLAEAPDVAGRAPVEVAQVISSVTVAPADTVVVGPGSMVRFEAEAVDANGSFIPGLAFMWSSSDPTVATIDGSGIVTTTGQGVTSIEASTGGTSASTDLTVLTTAGYSAVWVGSDPGGGRDWSNQNNWLPRRVPTVDDTVLVAADAAEQPRLTSDRSVAALVVEEGASVDLDGFVLTLAQDLDAGGGLVGPGRVRMIGAGASIRGALPDLMVHGTVEAGGPVVVTGDLVVEGPGTGLDLGAHEVAVTGALRVRDGATLTMQEPSGVLDVDGEAVFDGGPTLGLLTDGVLRVGGNLTAWTSDPRSFAPTGGHATVLDGSVVQVVYLHHNGPDESRFQTLEVDNPGGVTLSSTVRVDDVILTSGTLEGVQTVVLSGNLTEVVGGNQYQVLNTTFTGSPSLPPSVQTNATFTQAFAPPGDLELLGSLIVRGVGATLDVGASSVSIAGDLSTADGGTVTMQDPAGILDVAGTAFFDGGSTLGRLTAGTLRVGGQFTAWTSDPRSFAPTGTHATILDGASAQSVYLHHNGVDESRFNALELDNPVGATLYQTTRVAGNVVLTRGTLDGEQTMVIGGDLVEAIGGNQYRVLNTTFTGSPSLPASIRTNATFTATHAVSQDLEVVGDVFVDGSGATLDVGAHTVSVTGAFRTAAGGTLTMQDPAGVLDVEGEAEFNGGSTLGLLTEGELRLAGSFTAWTSHPENFAPTGAHRTTLDGTEEQTVYLYHSGADQARFEDLVVDNAVGATFFGTVRVTDTLTVSTALNVDVGAVALVAGVFTLESGATLTNEGSLQANDCQLLGTVVGNAPVCP